MASLRSRRDFVLVAKPRVNTDGEIARELVRSRVSVFVRLGNKILALILRASVQKNQKLSGKFQIFKITETLAIGGPY